MRAVTFAACAALFIGLLLLWRRDRRLRARTRVLTDILDRADALERELLHCRARLREIPALTARLSPSAQLSARATLAAEPQVQDALRDLLAHRLWLKERADSVSLTELETARDALAATQISLSSQMVRLAAVRSDFEKTRAAIAPIHPA